MTEETLPRLLAVVEPIAVHRSTTDLGRTEKPSAPTKKFFQLIPRALVATVLDDIQKQPENTAILNNYRLHKASLYCDLSEKTLWSEH